MLQAGRAWVRDQMKWMNFVNLPNPSAALVAGVHSASNRNEYQKQENTSNVCGEWKASGA
jgi:hypothetical protein